MESQVSVPYVCSLCTFKLLMRVQHMGKALWVIRRRGVDHVLGKKEYVFVCAANASVGSLSSPIKFVDFFLFA